MEVDLFASKHNAKLRRYVSFMPEPQAIANNALTMDWTGKQLYAFPPLPVMAVVLHKIRLEKCLVILIAPNWPSRPWFADLLSLVVARPRELPNWSNLFYNPVTHERQNNHFKYHAWLLSSSPSMRQHFLRCLAGMGSNTLNCNALLSNTFAICCNKIQLQIH